MKTIVALPVLMAGSVLLSGCFDGSSSTPRTDVRVVHAVSDAPSVNVSFNGEALVTGADFKQAATLRPNRGNYSVDVDALLPTGDQLTVIEVGSTRFEANTRYDIIATGTVGGSDIEPVVLTDDGQRDDPNSARLRVAHLSPAADSLVPAVSVYVTADGADLPAEPAFSFAFRDSVGPLELDAGTYQIRVTAEGSTDVVYDSGAVELPAGSDLLIAAIDNTVYGESPVSLLVINGSETSEILDKDTGAGIRAVHNSSDAPNVDIYLNEDPDGSAAATDVAFGETVPTFARLGEYVGLETGDNRVAVTATGELTAVLDEDLALDNGSLLTILAAGSVGAGTLEALAFADDNRRIATEARLRVIHGAVEAPLVDVCLVPAADAGTNQGNAMPALDDFAYGDSSGYLGVPAGDYVVFITSADGTEVLFRSGEISLAAGGVYTAVARLAPEDTENTAGLTLLDDFVPPAT